MSEIVDLLGAAGSVAGGGAFGLVGAGLGQVVKAFTAKGNHKRSMELMEFELKARESGHGQALDVMRQNTSGNGLTESIRADASIQNLPGWAAAVKALYRPFLTTLLVMIAGYIFNELLAAVGGIDGFVADLNREEILAMLRYTVYSLVFAASTAVVWWFGDRAMSPPAQK